MAAPSKEQQVAESEAKRVAGVEPGEHQAADTIDDGSPLDPGAAPRQQAEPTPAAPPAPPVKSRFDDKRNEIISRFRVDRGQENHGEDAISEFAREGMPPEFVPETPAVEEAADEQTPAAADATLAPPAPAPQDTAPKTVKLKVHHREIEMPLEEVIAKAQIALAADDLLEQAKGRVRELDAIVASARNTAPRAGQPGEHQTGQNSAPNAEPASPAGEELPHQEDPITKLIETMQFGDPTEARNLFDTTIKSETAKAVHAGLINQRLEDEGARTAKVLKDFRDVHPELASDPIANAAIERMVFDNQAEDLKQLGLDPAKLGNGTPADIAAAHRWYRAQGYTVTSPKEMLEKATSKLVEWKGVKPTEPAPPAPKPTPRIEVDRTARRQAIPQQPNRTAAPRPDPQQQSVKPRSRQEIVAAEIARRNAPRGRVAG